MKNNKKILVTGGAGYIGSHTILALITEGYKVVSIDNFSNSNEENFKAIEKITGQKVINYEIDLCNYVALDKVLNKEKFEAIIHFAAFKYVGESSKYPVKYYHNNLVSFLNVIKGLEKYKINNFVFSSSCTVYGTQKIMPVTEIMKFQKAESHYGRTKQICEEILDDLEKQVPGMKSLSLRYFNPAGLHHSGLLEETSPIRQETLVPIIQEVYEGKREYLEIFGSDYDTRDGTCIRDYIHIEDLAEAHVKAISFLFSKASKEYHNCINIGTGTGTTTLEMVHAVENISSKKLNYKFGPRRIGDIEKTYADSEKANKLLAWKASKNIEEILNSVLTKKQK